MMMCYTLVISWFKTIAMGDSFPFVDMASVDMIIMVRLDSITTIFESFVTLTGALQTLPGES